MCAVVFHLYLPTGSLLMCGLDSKRGFSLNERKIHGRQVISKTPNFEMRQQKRR